MTKHKVNVRNETVERYDTETRCDRCGSTLKHVRGRLHEVTIQLRTGSSWPESGSGDYDRIDVCPACWPTAKQALEAAGFTFHIEEWDY